MDNVSIAFSFDEVKQINNTLYTLYNENLSFEECIDLFMSELGKQVYFDKRDFTFFSYNSELNIYEIQAFFPANWDQSAADHYIETYMHVDDVLPILAQPHEIAFRNNDIFSDDRKNTKYYKEFLQVAQLEISIDANIPLPEHINMFVIFALYRNSGRKEFSLKELEIIKLYQKHLSRIFTKHLSQKEQFKKYESFILFDKFESLGICVLDSNFNYLSYSSTFKSFIPDNTLSIQDSPLCQQVKEFAKQLSEMPTETKLDITIEDIGETTFAFEISRYYHDSTKYICIVYPLTEFIATRLSTLKTNYKLSNREFEILCLMLKKGMTNEEIANQLFISPTTVKRHISNIYQKLGINNQKQLLPLLKLI